MEPIEQKMIETAGMLIASQTDIQVAGLTASGAVNMPEPMMKSVSAARLQHAMGQTIVNKLTE